MKEILSFWVLPAGYGWNFLDHHIDSASVETDNLTAQEIIQAILLERGMFHWNMTFWTKGGFFQQMWRVPNFTPPFSKGPGHKASSVPRPPPHWGCLHDKQQLVPTLRRLGLRPEKVAVGLDVTGFCFEGRVGMLAHLQVVGDKQRFKCRYNRWRIEMHFMGKLNCYKILQVHKGTIKMWLLHTYCPHSSKKVGKTLRRCLITNEYKLTLVAYYVQTAYKSIIIVTSFLLYITSSSTLPCSMHLRKWHLPGASKTCRNLWVFSTALSLPVSCCQAILEATGSNLDTR